MAVSINALELTNTAKLSDEVIQILESGRNEVYYSIASVWEIAIKHKIKPEQMPIDEEEFVRLCERTGFSQLLVEPEHVFMLKTLNRPENAPKHNDPFDRMLLAQAKYEKLSFITHDSLIPYYGEKCVVKM